MPTLGESIVRFRRYGVFSLFCVLFMLTRCGYWPGGRAQAGVFRQSEGPRLRVAGRDAIGVINAATMSAPKPFLATAMGGIVVVICTFIVVAGGFVLLLVNSAHH